MTRTLPDIERYVVFAEGHASVSFIGRLGSLETFLHEVTGVEEAAVLAYLSDGRRLRDENIRELAGAVDQVYR